MRRDDVDDQQESVDVNRICSGSGSVSVNRLIKNVYVNYGDDKII